MSTLTVASSDMQRATVAGRSTVGLVLDGVEVVMVMPGGPSSKSQNNGQKIEPGDLVKMIDGVAVDKHVGDPNGVRYNHKKLQTRAHTRVKANTQK